MTSNAASTSRLAAGGPASVDSADAVEEAARLVEHAEQMLGRYLQPGRQATTRARQRFLAGDALQTVLSDYARAMEKDPGEPAHPWNLASSLDRLGLADLALGFMRRAIRVAREVGDDEWGGADAHLAWADLAIRAGAPETAAIAIDHARRLDPHVEYQPYMRRLRRELAPPDRVDAAPNGVRHEDAARKGAAVEHLIAASCMMASDFALDVSTSLVDDEGVDLVFHRRPDSAMLAIQIKSRSWAASTMRRNGRFIAHVRPSTFRARRDLYLLFVAIDLRFAEYGPLWLVPSEDFARIVTAPKKAGLRFSASAAPGSEDQWSGYRLERTELSDRILNVLAELDDERSSTAAARRR